MKKLIPIFSIFFIIATALTFALMTPIVATSAPVQGDNIALNNVPAITHGQVQINHSISLTGNTHFLSAGNDSSTIYNNTKTLTVFQFYDDAIPSVVDMSSAIAPTLQHGAQALSEVNLITLKETLTITHNGGHGATAREIAVGLTEPNYAYILASHADLRPATIQRE